jgi:hypothetical protein
MGKPKSHQNLFQTFCKARTANYDGRYIVSMLWYYLETFSYYELYSRYLENTLIRSSFVIT